MEINPEHPVTQELREQWHKICAVVLHKLKISYIGITAEDLTELGPDVAVIAHAKKDMLEIRLMTLAEAKQYAKDHPGTIQS